MKRLLNRDASAGSSPEQRLMAKLYSRGRGDRNRFVICLKIFKLHRLSFQIAEHNVTQSLQQAILHRKDCLNHGYNDAAYVFAAVSRRNLS